MRRAGALLASLATATALGVAGLSARPLENRDPKTAPPLPTPAKLQAQERIKTCSAYGVGFVALPGSDACVKIGGGVTMEATGIGH